MTVDARSRPVLGRSQHPLIAAGRSVIRGYGRATARWRPDPDFLVIGAKRGGSTSFFYDLHGHPNVAPLFPRPVLLPKAEATKGIHYFDQHYARGESWYRSHLPSRAARARQRHNAGAPVIVGEASPYYLFHPAAPARAAALLPHVKLIAVLRDPVQRTYSHWKERRRQGAEELDFVDALAAEDERLGSDEQRLREDPTFYSYAHEQQSYVRQSQYDIALARWLGAFPREQLLVLSSEDYYSDPTSVLDRAQRFLGLPVRDIASGTVRNAAVGERIDPDVADALAARFAPHNARLQELTGESFNWR